MARVSLAVAALARVVEARDHGQEAVRRLERQGRATGAMSAFHSRHLVAFGNYEFKIGFFVWFQLFVQFQHHGPTASTLSAPPFVVLQHSG